MIKPVLMSMVSDYTPDSSSGKVLGCSSLVDGGGHRVGGHGDQAKPAEPFLGSTCVLPTYIPTYLPTNPLARTLDVPDEPKIHFQATLFCSSLLEVGMFTKIDQGNVMWFSIVYFSWWAGCGKILLGTCETKAWSIGRKIGGREEVGEG